MEPKISIIIPVFNRNELVSYTLDSIIAQTYQNWECVIIDDNSTDDSLDVIKEYSKKDSRIKSYSRPENLLKGANSCRNFGFQKSIGEYIIWFDSDDLMTTDHVSAKMQKISESNADFVVARTQNFRDGELLEPYHYEIKDYGIKASDFILLKIHWYTYDVMLKREMAEKIEWNEKMKSWQDYNYFCKMLLVTENGVYLDKILTHRRLHEKSIQKSLTRNSVNFSNELLENRLLTFQDISEKIDAVTRKELVFGLMNLSVELSKRCVSSKYEKNVIQIVRNELGSVSKLYFKASLVTARLLKKHHYLLNKAKKR